MWKKILIPIILIVIAIFAIESYYFFKQNNKIMNGENNVEDEIELSLDTLQDECLNEWNDYAIALQEELEEVSHILNEEKRRYVLRNKDNYINVYYLDDNGNEILYKQTNISVEYLDYDDINKLNVGVTVEGAQEMNKLLEDFE